MPKISEPQYIIDNAGNKIAAVVPIADYEILLDALEEINDLQTIDEMRKNGELADTVPLADVLARYTNDAAA